MEFNVVVHVTYSTRRRVYQNMITIVHIYMLLLLIMYHMYGSNQIRSLGRLEQKQGSNTSGFKHVIVMISCVDFMVCIGINEQR